MASENKNHTAMDHGLENPLVSSARSDHENDSDFYSDRKFGVYECDFEDRDYQENLNPEDLGKKKYPNEPQDVPSTSSNVKLSIANLFKTKSKKTYTAIPLVDYAKAVNHISHQKNGKSDHYISLLFTYQKLFLKFYLENKRMQTLYSIAYYSSSCIILAITVILSSLTQSNFEEHQSTKSLLVFYLTIFVSIGTAILNFLRIETVIQKYEYCKSQYFDLFQDVSFYLSQWDASSKDIEQFHSVIVEKNKHIQNMQQNISSCAKSTKNLFLDHDE